MGDVLGEALTDYYSGKRERVVIRREDGRENSFPLEDLFSPHSKWLECEKKALESVFGRVLDLGGGVGRHSLWLQEKGFDVVAVDISRLAVKVARARGVVKAVVMKAQKLAFAPLSFDTVLLLGNNFGVCGTVEETEDMMSQLHEITSRKGRVIATSIDVTKTKKPEHLAYQELNRKRGRPPGQVTLRIEYQGKTGEWFNLLMVGPEQMEEMCSSIGWTIEKIYESEDSFYSAILGVR